MNKRIEEIVEKVEATPSHQQLWWVAFDGQNDCLESDDLKLLADHLRAVEALLGQTNDLSGFNWHIQRRRENNRFEWLSTKGESVYGPFDSILEAFAALK